MNQSQKTALVSILFIGSLATLLYVWLDTGGTNTGGVAPLRPGLIRATDLEKGETDRIAAPPPAAAESTLVRMARAFLTPVIPPAVPESPRNIFDYPPPPPPKPVPPPPPPPITLQSVYPPRVYARSTMTYELTVEAQPLPEGVQVVIDGKPLAAERKGDHQLRVRLTPDLTAQPRSATVRMIVPGQEAKWYSNDLTLTVDPPPNPNEEYRYIGMVTDAGGQNPRAVLATANEYQTVHPNEPIGRFRVKTITSEQVVVEDTQLPGVSHTMPLSAGPTPTSSAIPSPVSGYRQGGYAAPGYQAPQSYQVGQPPFQYDNSGQPIPGQLKQPQSEMSMKPAIQPQDGRGGMPVIMGDPNTVKPADGTRRPIHPFNRQRPPNQ
ncbi:MAG: hypothetical protein ACUVR8_10765 [Acidobacteriota bacterium]